MIIGGSLFALSSLILQLLLLYTHIPLPAILIVMALLLGVTAEISSLHARLATRIADRRYFYAQHGREYADLETHGALYLRHHLVRRLQLVLVPAMA